MHKLTWPGVHSGSPCLTCLLALMLLLLCKGSRLRSVTVSQVSKASCVQVFVQWVVVGILAAIVCCGLAIWYILLTERRQNSAVQSGLDRFTRVGVLGITHNAATVLASNNE